MTLKGEYISVVIVLVAVVVVAASTTTTTTAAAAAAAAAEEEEEEEEEEERLYVKFHRQFWQETAHFVFQRRTVRCVFRSMSG